MKYSEEHEVDSDSSMQILQPAHGCVFTPERRYEAFARPLDGQGHTGAFSGPKVILAEGRMTTRDRNREAVSSVEDQRPSSTWECPLDYNRSVSSKRPRRVAGSSENNQDYIHART